MVDSLDSVAERAILLAHQPQPISSPPWYANSPPAASLAPDLVGGVTPTETPERERDNLRTVNQDLRRANERLRARVAFLQAKLVDFGYEEEREVGVPATAANTTSSARGGRPATVRRAVPADPNDEVFLCAACFAPLIFWLIWKYELVNHTLFGFLLGMWAFLPGSLAAIAGVLLALRLLAAAFGDLIVWIFSSYAFWSTGVFGKTPLGLLAALVVAPVVGGLVVVVISGIMILLCFAWTQILRSRRRRREAIDTSVV
ncbi:hypothetical protein JCM8097_006260 [Rhodosporidiobolus ruineniae]